MNRRGQHLPPGPHPSSVPSSAVPLTSYDRHHPLPPSSSSSARVNNNNLNNNLSAAFPLRPNRESPSPSPPPWPPSNNHAPPAPPPSSLAPPGSGPVVAIPEKRGARACTACRKGKNRCEGDCPCRRCAAAGIECVFEKPVQKRKTENHSADYSGDYRVARLENDVTQLHHSQGNLQASINQILSLMTASQAPHLQQNQQQQQASPQAPSLQHRPSSSSSSTSHLPSLADVYPQTHQPQQHALTAPFTSTSSSSLPAIGSGNGYLSLPSLTNGGPGVGPPSPATAAVIQHAASSWAMLLPAPSPTPSGSGASGPSFRPGPSSSSMQHQQQQGSTGGASGVGSTGPSQRHWPPRSDGPQTAAGESSAPQNGNGAATTNNHSSTAGNNPHWPGGTGHTPQATTTTPGSGYGAGDEGAGSSGPMPGSSEAAALEAQRRARRAKERERRAASRGNGEGGANGGNEDDEDDEAFPALPGFVPPPTHRFANYGIVPSTAVSSEDESEDTLPRASLMAPSLALEGLANAAAEAASGALSPPRVMRMKKRKRVESPPRNAFPDVVTKGLVSEQEARSLYDIFFSGSHLFVPLFDPQYDTFESLRERTPFTLDGILAIAAKVRAGASPPGEVFRKCFDEAQGIARSTLFGPVVRKEAVQATLLLATHSQNGWLPSGHALRMGLDIGLHMALGKLVAGPSHGEDPRTEAEERDLVVSSRIYLTLFWFDRLMSLGTGRPILLRDDDSVFNARFLLSHPMSSATDVRLVSQLELVILKTRVYDHLQPLKGKVDQHTLAYIRRVYSDLDSWYGEWDDIHKRSYTEESVLRKMLLTELHYAKLWVVCCALRGASWDRMPYEQREIAFEAKEAAMRVLDVYLKATHYRAALRYAVHESMVMGSFAACYLLKVCILFPSDIDVRQVLEKVEELAGLLSEISAERYALTLRLMIRSCKRRFAMTVPSTPTSSAVALPNGGMHASDSMGWGGAGTNGDGTDFGGGVGATGEGGAGSTFDWPEGLEEFSPGQLPAWLQDSSLTDLGLPVEGSDSIFLSNDMANFNFLLDPSHLYSAAW